MACNCPGTRRSTRLTKKATRIATHKANAGIAIKKAKPKKIAAKRIKAKPAKPCHCT